MDGSHTDGPAEGEAMLGPFSDDHPLFNSVVEAIRTVHDPEIPVNIYDLGLIYRIEINADSDVDVDMTLTAPGCPVAGEMPGWIVDAVEPIPGVRTVNVNLVWEPPWGMDMLSDEAKLELGFI
ncbi:SUF system Fe-S cluster assembly protein [Rhodovulum sp. DZ06]|uniref:SUF system Fe-S cluster assembly protein n=1 Tax=Rhodovulum sp. DZ06 TaxID=3425126 RepID=UPI003D3425AA